MTMDTADQIHGLDAQMKLLMDEVAGLLERTPAAMATEDMDGLAKLCDALDRLQDTVNSGRKHVNRAVEIVAEHFCKRMLDENIVKHRYERMTFSASVRGYFSVTRPREFLASIDGDVDTLCRLVHSVDEMRTFCEGRLEAGDTLPPGVSQHIVAKVHIRRPRNGQDDEQ